MQEDNKIEERIQDYLDGLCNEKEAAEIKQNIATDPVWKAAFESLFEMHQMLLADFEPLEPSMRFSKNVMEQIAGLTIAKPTRQYLNPIVIWMMGGLLATMLVLVFGYAISLEDWSATGSIAGISMPELKLPAIDWNSYISSNTTMLFLLINTVLGFALFDTWLKRKKAVG